MRALGRVRPCAGEQEFARPSPPCAPSCTPPARIALRQPWLADFVAGLLAEPGPAGCGRAEPGGGGLRGRRPGLQHHRPGLGDAPPLHRGGGVPGAEQLRFNSRARAAVPRRDQRAGRWRDGGAGLLPRHCGALCAVLWGGAWGACGCRSASRDAGAGCQFRQHGDDGHPAHPAAFGAGRCRCCWRSWRCIPYCCSAPRRWWPRSGCMPRRHGGGCCAPRRSAWRATRGDGGGAALLGGCRPAAAARRGAADADLLGAAAPPVALFCLGGSLARIDADQLAGDGGRDALKLLVMPAAGLAGRPGHGAAADGNRGRGGRRRAADRGQRLSAGGALPIGAARSGATVLVSTMLSVATLAGLLGWFG